MKYGVDIGGTKIELAIYDGELNRVNAWRTATPKMDYPTFLQTLSDMITEADRQTGGCGSVGIGLPGIVDARGRAISSNIPAINGEPIAEDLPRLLDRSVYFENDVKAFAFSEANGGAAHGAKHALGIVLGTGVAGGLCVNGELYNGKQNMASEYGHVLLPAVLQQRYQFPLRVCGCGGVSCVEQYLSGPGLNWMCSHFGASYDSVPALVQALESKETKALEVFAAYVDCLGCYLAQFTLMLDPDVIVLGGGLSNIGALYERLPEAMSPYLFDGVTCPQVLPPTFGDSSGVRGAAILGSRGLGD